MECNLDRLLPSLSSRNVLAPEPNYIFELCVIEQLQTALLESATIVREKGWNMRLQDWSMFLLTRTFEEEHALHTWCSRILCRKRRPPRPCLPPLCSHDPLVEHRSSQKPRPCLSLRNTHPGSCGHSCTLSPPAAEAWGEKLCLMSGCTLATKNGDCPP